MAKTLTDDQRARCIDVFNRYDSSGNGQVPVGKNLQTLAEMLEKVGFTEAGTHALLQQVDVKVSDGGTLGLEDFLSLSTQKLEDEYLSKTELKMVLSVLGENLTDSEVQEMIREADLDGDGQINYKEFVNMMLAT
mmetsp:Transcript_33531/g.53456  ORF Transcript_33531/g.53456 Transcript_33531/m.53456 type:complete len:135 (-) Transcript_33531:29-433(-)